MKEKLIKIIKEEINLLQKWIDTSNTGGWSTHLVDPMQKRRTELVLDLYKLENEQ